MLNLHKLQVFVTVARVKSFTRAAEELLLTQSAVSQHIQGLEAQLGTRLFERSHRGVRLTRAGEVLLEYAQRILQLIAEAEEAVAATSERSASILRIGGTPIAAGCLLPGWIRTFRQAHPRQRVSLHTASTDQVVADLLQDRLDLGFVEGDWTPIPELDHLPLHNSELHLVVGPDHPWWGREQISIRELDHQLFIAFAPRSPVRGWEDELFQRFQVSPMVIAEFDDPEAIKRAVMEGMEAAILPCCVVQHEVEAGRLHRIPFQEQPLRHPIRLLRRRDRPLSRPAQAFIRSLIPQFPQLAQWDGSPQGMALAEEPRRRSGREPWPEPAECPTPPAPPRAHPGQP